MNSNNIISNLMRTKLFTIFFALVAGVVTISAKTIYLNTGGSSLWGKDGADHFAVWHWQGSGSGSWSSWMSMVEANIWSVEISDSSDKVIFCRFNNSASSPDWTSSIWNQTEDLEPGPNNLFTITGWSDGIWSIYEATHVKMGDLYYIIEFDKKIAKVVGDSNKYSGNIIIPSSFEYSGTTFKVVSIEERSFEACSNMTSIEIPNSVTSIGYMAFSDCSSLTTIVWNAKNCPILEKNGYIYPPFYSIRENITSFTIGNEVEVIPSYLCYGMKKLTSILISNSVTNIGDYAFFSCSDLTSATIGNGVTSIGSAAFADCTNLKSINWNSINCTDFSYNNPFCYFREDNYEYDIRNKITSFTFGNEVEYIPAYLCSKMNQLTSVTIPNSVTNIGEYAFDECTSLTSVTLNSNDIVNKSSIQYIFGEQVTEYIIGSDVTSIGYGTFAYCSGMTSVIIPNSVTSIGDYAFDDCSSLTSITIPNSVTNIGESAFAYCTGLKSVTLPNSVTSIGQGVFAGCSGMTSVTIPNSVTSIGDYAFDDCSSLTSITIPNSVTSIGVRAFYGCSGLTNVTIGNGVTSIGDAAFSGCSGLTSVTIPNNVTSIGYMAFFGCFGLTRVVIENGNTVYDSRDNCNALIETSTNTLIFGCQNTIIPNGVTSIGQAAFFECSGLTSVTIPNSVTSIGGGAFHGCSGLTSVIIPNSVTSIGDAAFYGCSGLTTPVYNANCFAYLPNPYSGEYAIPDGIKQVIGCAFYGCSGLTSVVIPNSVTSIGYCAFYDCSGLTSITNYAATPQTINSEVFVLVNKSTCKLYVPEESINLYRAANGWNEFLNILPIGAPQGIDHISNDKYQMTHKVIENGQVLILKGEKVYTIQGQEVK